MASEQRWTYIQARSLDIGSGLLNEMPGQSVGFQAAVRRK